MKEEKEIKILAIESSCDETAAAVIRNGRRVAVLGDMYELGDKAKNAHFKIGEYARDKVDLLIVIGEQINNFKDGFKNDNIIMYNTKEECIKELKSIVKKNDVILIKASRGMKLEYVVKSLEEM